MHKPTKITPVHRAACSLLYQIYEMMRIADDRNAASIMRYAVDAVIHDLENGRFSIPVLLRGRGSDAVVVTVDLRGKDVKYDVGWSALGSVGMDTVEAFSAALTSAIAITKLGIDRECDGVDWRKATELVRTLVEAHPQSLGNKSLYPVLEEIGYTCYYSAKSDAKSRSTIQMYNDLTWALDHISDPNEVHMERGVDYSVFIAAELYDRLHGSGCMYGWNKLSLTGDTELDERLKKLDRYLTGDRA
jgi:hypothetical protein